MSMGTYYLLSNPSKLAKLVEELKTVPKSDRGLLEYRKVNTLPYLVRVQPLYHRCLLLACMTAR